MTERSQSTTHAARAGGRPLARTGLLALAVLITVAPRAQTPTWEMLPLVPNRAGQNIYTLDFLHGVGVQADDPTADSLVAVRANGVFLYNPSGAAGAAGDNGEWGAWHPLCTSSACSVEAGLVTAAGSLVIGGRDRDISRSTDRGRTWTHHVANLYPVPMTESAVPSAAGSDGTPAIVAAVSDDGNTARSLGDGAPGTWTQAGNGAGFPQALGEVPASASLPGGRLLYGVWNGVLYSDDGALTWVRSSAYGQARYIAWSFAFRPVAGHPYGGTAYAGVQNVATGGEGAGAEVLRSDDGGATWSLAHAFTAAEMGLPVPAGTDVTEVIVLAAPDGALWAGVNESQGALGPQDGGIMRSTDGGATWTRADSGFRTVPDQENAVKALVLSRTGVLYAATERGVWRTTTAVVAGEASPVEAEGVAVSVRPNPAGGRVEVVVSLATAQAVRVVVLDALGREVAVVLDGEAVGERVVAVDTGSWPAGVYVVRASTGTRVASARLVVAR